MIMVFHGIRGMTRFVSIFRDSDGAGRFGAGRVGLKVFDE
jgi:hypothetical protein